MFSVYIPSSYSVNKLETPRFPFKSNAYVLGSHCQTRNCSCVKSRIPCTAFCGCVNDGCQNEFSTGSNEEESDEVECTSGDEDGEED